MEERPAYRGPDEPTFNRPLLAFPERLMSLGRNWGVFLAAGIGFIIIGLAAFSWPVASTVSLTFALGILFIVSGVVHLVQAFRLRKETDSVWRFVYSLVPLAAGILMLRYPGSGMIGIAIAMVFYFFMSSAAKFVAAFGIRPHRGWGWTLVSAVASFLLGVYMIATFPISALWVPGFLLGIDLLVYGASMIGLSFELRRTHRKLEEPGERPGIEKAA